jgi:hypothetical protein
VKRQEEPLELEGELIVDEAGDVTVGRHNLGSEIYEWCHGRMDRVRVKIESIDDEE